MAAEYEQRHGASGGRCESFEAGLHSSTEQSHMARARFQAAATMQKAAIREWLLLTADERSNLLTYCVHYVMARDDGAEAYAQMEVLAVAVVLVKRGCMCVLAETFGVRFR